ncbi:hypothetical protein GW537_08055 [Piscirickettsia salmonis]|nr:hypothetical protein [Piscirickettsia salmonis]QHS25944.1 hypothetical protein GW538_08330 [Piscirickettsia salmonis]QHS29071.1 hypothetical protein GW537_08055 [Piscirickettsia salmonis]
MTEGVLGLIFIPLSNELSWVLFHCADLQITWLINRCEPWSAKHGVSRPR